jgi:hypothetical protein
VCPVHVVDGVAATEAKLTRMSTGAWVKAYGVALVSLISGASAMHWVLAPDTVRAPAPQAVFRVDVSRCAGVLRTKTARWEYATSDLHYGYVTGAVRR